MVLKVEIEEARGLGSIQQSLDLGWIAVCQAGKVNRVYLRSHRVHIDYSNEICQLRKELYWLGAKLQGTMYAYAI